MKRTIVLMVSAAAMAASAGQVDLRFGFGYGPQADGEDALLSAPGADVAELCATSGAGLKRNAAGEVGALAAFEAENPRADKRRPMSADWLRDALGLYLGFKAETDGLRLHPLADGRWIEMSGLVVKGCPLKVRLSGNGPYSAAVFNDRAVKGGFVPWTDFRASGNHLVIHCFYPATKVTADVSPRGDVLMTCAALSAKGNRAETQPFPCAKPEGESAYYTVSFKAKVKGGRFNYWWMDFFDRDGKTLADVNSKLYPSEDWRNYEELFQAVPAAVTMQNAYCVSAKSPYSPTSGTAEIRDVTLRRVTDEEAAAWCDRTYLKLPQIDWEAPRDALWRLPKTRTALVRHQPLRVVMLGGSLCNDSYNGHFSAILKRAFPLSDITVVASVRGGTGVWYYEKPEAFKEYVLDLRPDLLVVAGICHRAPMRDCEMDREIYFERFADLCRRHGVEVVFCTPPLSKDFRATSAVQDYDFAKLDPGLVDVSLYETEYLKRLSVVKNVPLWDVTWAPCQALAQSGEPINAWMRDIVHNDDRAKQANARAIAAHFLTAIRDEYAEGGNLLRIPSDWAVVAPDGRRRPFAPVVEGHDVRVLSQSWRLRPDPTGGRIDELAVEYRASAPVDYVARFFDRHGTELAPVRLTLPATEGVVAEKFRTTLVLPEGATYVRHAFIVNGRFELKSFGIGKRPQRMSSKSPSASPVRGTGTGRSIAA